MSDDLIPLGSIVELDLDLSSPEEDGVFVELKGRASLYVVGCHPDTTATGDRIYILSDLPVVFPEEDDPEEDGWFDTAKMVYCYIASVVEYAEEGDFKFKHPPSRDLYPNTEAYLQDHQ